MAYEDDHRHVVDFHSLRKTFITNLTRSSVTPKTAQLLARHSDINLTMNTYTALGVLDQAVAVEVPTMAPNGPHRARYGSPKIAPKRGRRSVRGGATQ